MKTTKTKTKKITAAIVAFVLIGFVIYIGLGLTGNPISKMIANNSAQKYVDKKYKDLDLKLEDASYNFKSGRYVVAAASDTSIDTHFEMNFTPTGKLEYDGYEGAVLNKWNTWARINDEYRSLADTVLEDNFPYGEKLGFGELIDVYSDYNHLEIDKNYDIKEMAKEEGNIILVIQSKTLDKETMARVLLEVKELFDKKDVPFYSIELTLEEPRTDGLPTGVDINILGFLYRDIYPEELEKRVEENMEATKKLYEDMDNEKDHDIEEVEEEIEEEKNKGK